MGKEPRLKLETNWVHVGRERGCAHPSHVRRPAFKNAPRGGLAKMSDYIMGGVWKGFEVLPLPREN